MPNLVLGPEPNGDSQIFASGTFDWYVLPMGAMNNMCECKMMCSQPLIKIIYLDGGSKQKGLSYKNKRF